MHWRFRRGALAIVLIAALPVTIGAAPASTNSSAEDLRQSYQLLTTTYYSKVEAQRLLDGARQALATEAGKHGARITLPTLHDTDSMQGNVNEVLATIGR